MNKPKIGQIVKFYVGKEVKEGTVNQAGKNVMFVDLPSGRRILVPYTSMNLNPEPDKPSVVKKLNQSKDDVLTNIAFGLAMKFLGLKLK